MIILDGPWIIIILSNVFKFNNLRMEEAFELIDSFSADELNKIYQLRLNVWLNSNYLKKEDYPNGITDNLDVTAKIWAAKHENSIIATGRVNIIENFDCIEYNEVFDVFEKKDIIINFPVAFFSKLVVHPSFQNLGLSKKIDNKRYQYSIENNVKTLVLTTDKTFRADKLIKMGWINIGRINPNLYKSWHYGHSHILIKNIAK